MHPNRRPVTGRVGTLAACALAALAVVFACNSPFIPVPPPGDPTFVPVEINEDQLGMRTLWEVRGDALPAMAGARVFIFNDSADSGVITRARADGSYTSGLLDGLAGDRVQISYETADDRESSPVICRVLMVGRSMQPCPPRDTAADAGRD